MWCVYIIKYVEGFFYIGHTGNVKKRLRAHNGLLRNGKHFNIKWQRLYNNGELTEYNVETLPCSSKDKAYELENNLIVKNKINPFMLNISVFTDTLSKHPDKKGIIRKRQISQRKVLEKLSKEDLKRIYGKPGEKNGMYGRSHTAEVKERLRKLNTGKISKLRGTKYSDEKRERYKEAIRNKRRSYKGEGNPFYGKRHSEELMIQIHKSRMKIVTHPDYIHPLNKKASINGTVYKSASHAARDLNMSHVTVSHRCKSKNPKFKDWYYVNECPEHIESISSIGENK